MAAEVEVIVFKQPTDNVRGLVNAYVDLGDKIRRLRIAHATLRVDTPTDVLVEVPKRLAPAEILICANGLTDFAAKLKELETPAIPDAPDAATFSAEAGATLTYLEDGTVLRLLQEEDLEKWGSLEIEHYGSQATRARINPFTGAVWATGLHISVLAAHEPRPKWATHVMWPLD